MKINNMSTAVLIFFTVIFASSFALAEKDEAYSIRVKISLPDLFNTYNMNDSMKVYTIDKNKKKKQCYLYSKDRGPSSYIYDCFYGESYLIEIVNFVPVNRIRGLSEKVNINLADLSFYVFHPDLIFPAVSYWLDGREITGKTSVSFPLEKLNQRIKVIPKAHNGKVPPDKCVSYLKFYLKDILEDRPPVISHDCNVKTSALPEKKKRQVIVISDSLILGDKGRGSAIQQALILWLNEPKQSKRPLNLLVIEGNGRIKQILRGEDLVNMELSSNEENPPPTIRGKIYSSLTFNAGGFNPLRDLEHVERALEALGIAELEKVIYFTNSSKEEKVYYADLGTPLGWMTEGIKVSIVTDSNCGLWTKKKAVVKCTYLKQFPDMGRIKQILNNF